VGEEARGLIVPDRRIFEPGEVDLSRQDVALNADSAVVKIGTNVLSAAAGGLDRDHLNHLCDQIVALRSAGKKIVVVSSGAIGAGLAKIGRVKRPSNLPALQAAAAVGQLELMKAWEAGLSRHGVNTAQLLLTAADFDDRTRYLNARNTLFELLRWNVVPIINENDTVGTAEIRFGDNDQLAAMVTNLIRAPLLVILSVVDGLLDADPNSKSSSRKNAKSRSREGDKPVPKTVDTVFDVDQALSLAGESTSGLGTGGMKSKLQAARLATSAGESVWIAAGRTPDVLRRIFAGERIGTFIPAGGGAMNSKKRWLGLTARPKGAYVVDAGAARALKTVGKSLLPVGVKSVRGTFGAGDLVTIEDQQGVVIARGLSNYDSNEARLVAGRSTAELRSAAPGCRFEEAVHRDNLALLGDD
jgi:glutamate 5-kinase